jgi:hypothetical protein
MRPIIVLCVALAFFGPVAADTLIVHTGLEYRVYLPDDWVLEEASDSQHYFFDTTGAFASWLSIVRYDRSAADFPAPEDWTRAYFIAYKLVAQYSVDPWGAVLYYDSSATSTQGALWAPEAYAMFFALDTAVGGWSEYTRFTASGAYGYELYALGDTADMLTNLATYAAILQGIDLPGSDVAVEYRQRPVVPVARHGVPGTSGHVFDARGRRVGHVTSALGALPGGAYVSRMWESVVALE